MNAPAQIGRYQILSTLGRGSMGCVYLALDPNIDRQVALKVLEPSRQLFSGEEEELRMRFILEAKATGRVSHPGIVTIHDTETDSVTGYTYIAMEFIAGPSLLDLLRESGRLGTSQAIAIVSEVALALQAAHDADLVHRDVKPANLLMTPEGLPKITDFGIAKFSAASHTAIGAVLGTPYYMSPEQVRGEVLDGRSDLFSLGVVLYQCLAGELPFQGETLASIAYMVNEVDPRPLYTLDPDFPPALSEVVERALQKPLDSRFQSGVEFAEALRRVESGQAPLPHLAPARRETAVAGSPKPATDTMIVSPPPSAAVPIEAKEQIVADSTGKRSQRGVDVVRGRPAVKWAWLLAAGTLLLISFVRTRESTEIGPFEGPGLTERISAAVPDGKTRTAGDGDTVEGGGPLHGGGDPGKASLRITHKSRLKNATISVSVDGEMVWSRSMNVGRRKFREKIVRAFTGQHVEGQVAVTEGRHGIRVRIRGSSGKVEAVEDIGGLFEKDQTRTLRVVFIPPKNLKLSWKS